MATTIVMRLASQTEENISILSDDNDIEEIDSHTFQGVHSDARDETTQEKLSMFSTSS